MDKIDYPTELNRLFAEYASFFDLPIRTIDGRAEAYTKLPRSLFSHLMLKESHLLELLKKGTLSLRELREDCDAFKEIAEGDFKGMDRPKVCLEVAGIPKARWPLYLPTDAKEEAPPSLGEIEFAKEPPPEVPASDRRRFLPHVLWGAGVLFAFLAGFFINPLSTGKNAALPPSPPVPVATDTPTETATSTPTDVPTATATSTPRPKPKPKPKATATRMPSKPSPVPTPPSLEEDEGIYTE